ncbi:hypothetical protein PWT90_07997 [Aphanocladium album]|nr:hypothetical protein PWT90_07997 [Aphanocladium album]
MNPAKLGPPSLRSLAVFPFRRGRGRGRRSTKASTQYDPTAETRRQHNELSYVPFDFDNVASILKEEAALAATMPTLL